MFFPLIFFMYLIGLQCILNENKKNKRNALPLNDVIRHICSYQRVKRKAEAQNDKDTDLYYAILTVEMK